MIIFLLFLHISALKIIPSTKNFASGMLLFFCCCFLILMISSSQKIFWCFCPQVNEISLIYRNIMGIIPELKLFTVWNSFVGSVKLKSLPEFRFYSS